LTVDGVDDLLTEVQRHHAVSPERLDVIRAVLAKLVELASIDTNVDDLRVAVSTLNELLDASTLFAQWRGVPKLAVFGSARTPVDSPLYEMAHDLSAAMAQRGWMTVSGAGPGIMEASAKGAGRTHTLGVNIELPFEQFANQFIDADTMLVAMQHFFTRKVAMTRPSNAFAIFPGGLGTMDETFEVLTLLHTGKSSPAPVVLMDSPEGTFWRQWMEFVEQAITADGYIDEHDLCLVRFITTVDDAVDEIERFYSNYRHFEVVEGRAFIGVARTPSVDQLNDVATQLPVFARDGAPRLDDDHTISFEFDGRNFVNLRLLIDQINAWS
jgi:uncharacterized protein (TIGR00730 family)